MIMGFMYSFQGGPMSLYVVDDDHTQASAVFIQSMNIEGVVNIADGSGMDLAQMLKDGKIAAYVVVPAGFGASAVPDSASTSQVQMFYDRTQATASALLAVVQQVTDHMNIQLAGATEKIALTPQDVTTSSVSPMEYILPGILGIGIMMCAINLTVGVNAKNRARGIFRKLATTPISRVEWNLAKIGTQTIIALIAIVLALGAAMLMFDLHPHIDAFTLVMVVLGTIAFVGLGLIMAAILKNEDTAAPAASILTFPLMFLSGTFFPVDMMPGALQAIAAISPLTYVNNGLRDFMITGQTDDGMLNMAIVAVIALALFAIGVMLMKWKEK
jgi:ABC-2 type transport system permease protein